MRRQATFADSATGDIGVTGAALVDLLLATIVLAALVIAPLRAAFGQRVRRAPAAACRDGGWSAAQQVRTPNGDYMYVERPAILPLGGATAFIGAPTDAFDSTARPVASWGHGAQRLPDSLADLAVGVLRRADGSFAPLRPPPGLQHPMRFPQGVSDGHRAVVLWGYALDSARRFTEVQEIWAATLDSAGWGAPELVVARPTMFWFRPGVDVTRAADGSVHAVVSVFTGGRGGVLHMWNAGGRWNVDSAWLPEEQRMYPQLEVLGEGRYVLAFTDAAKEVTNGMSSRLVVSRSDDGGRSWSEPVAVSTRASEDAFEPRLFRAGELLGIAWRQSPPGRGSLAVSPSGDADTVRLSLSRDGGRTWRAEPPLVAPFGIMDFELLAANGGALIGGQSPDAPERLSATWRAGAWHSLGSPQDPEDFTAPSLGRIGDGRYVMTWGRWFRYRHAVMLVSLLAPACAP